MGSWPYRQKQVPSSQFTPQNNTVSSGYEERPGCSPARDYNVGRAQSDRQTQPDEGLKTFWDPPLPQTPSHYGPGSKSSHRQGLARPRF